MHASARTFSISTSRGVSILGAGPSGSAAALAAITHGARVTLIERSSLPRHKVCGEFLSPEIAPVLDQLGVLTRFTAAQPFTVRRMALHFGRRRKSTALPEQAYGLSRYAFDDLLFKEALSRGASVVASGQATVVAAGRGASKQPRGERLFGFKAHYQGPTDDAVELFFFDDCYVGINCVEGGITNVCGLGPERLLSRIDWQLDELLPRCPALSERLRPLKRTMDWLRCGPLEFRQNWNRNDVFLAGDALSFVDPFTGSGLLCAITSGMYAGMHAAEGRSPEDHLLACRKTLERPFAFAGTLRRLASTQWAEWLVNLVPGQLLFRLTRPNLRYSRSRHGWSAL